MIDWNAIISTFLSSGCFGSLTEKDRRLIEGLINVASEKVDEIQSDADAAFPEQVEATMRNLQEIIHLFKKAEKARAVFGRKFPLWSPLRLDNIAKLRELAEKINTHRYKCNVSKFASTTLSLLGTTAAGAALIFPLTAPVAAASGLAVSALGGFSVFGASIAEMQFLRENMKEAEKVKDKEEEDFKLVALWFKHSQELIDAFDKIMGFSVFTEMKEDLKSFAAELTESSSGILNSRQVRIIKNCVAKMVVLTGSPHSSLVIALIPVVLAFIVVTVTLRKHNNFVFDSVVLTHRILFGMARFLDVGGDLGVMIYAGSLAAGGVAASELTANTAKMAASELTANTAKMAAHSVFAVVGLALDVTNLVYASIDLKKGSISPYAKQLKQAADQLEKEYEVLKKIYEELFQ